MFNINYISSQEQKFNKVSFHYDSWSAQLRFASDLDIIHRALLKLNFPPERGELDIIGNRAQECKKFVFAVKKALTCLQKPTFCTPVLTKIRISDNVYYCLKC